MPICPLVLLCQKPPHRYCIQGISVAARIARDRAYQYPLHNQSTSCRISRRVLMLCTHADKLCASFNQEQTLSLHFDAFGQGVWQDFRGQHK
jgi:hypothetical protein